MGEECVSAIENLRGLVMDLAADREDLGIYRGVAEDARGREG